MLVIWYIKTENPNTLEVMHKVNTGRGWNKKIENFISALRSYSVSYTPKDTNQVFYWQKKIELICLLFNGIQLGKRKQNQAQKSILSVCLIQWVLVYIRVITLIPISMITVSKNMFNYKRSSESRLQTFTTVVRNKYS